MNIGTSIIHFKAGGDIKKSPAKKAVHDHRCKCFLCIKRRPTFREKMVLK